MLGPVNRLLILAAEAAKYTSLIKAANQQSLEIRTATDVQSAKNQIDGCNIVLGDPPLVAEVLARAERLEWVQSSWAGVDHLCREGLRQDYILTGVKDVFGPSISEYVMTYLFSFERRLFSMRSNQLEKHWRPYSYRSSKEIRLGIVGLGSIGQALARTAQQFGIRVTGLNRTGKPCDKVDEVYTQENLAGFLKALDYIVLTLPATRKTRYFINAGVLKMMKPSAVLINVGRGNSVNEADLVSALRKGVIGGAVLDVFETEPLDRDSPLWLMPNVFITPHTAAVSFPADVSSIFIGNYQRFMAREPLLNVIDFELGY